MGPDRATIESRVLELAAEEVGLAPGSLRPDSTMLDVFDSLDETGFILRVETEFRVSLQPPFASAEANAIEARRPFRIRDFVDLVLAQRGSGWSEGSQCPRCGYSLAGLVGDRCPECGGTIGSPGETAAP